MSWGVHQRPGGVTRKREKVLRQRLAGAKGVVEWGPDRHWQGLAGMASGAAAPALGATSGAVTRRAYRGSVSSRGRRAREERSLQLQPRYRAHFSHMMTSNLALLPRRRCSSRVSRWRSVSCTLRRRASTTRRNRKVSLGTSSRLLFACVAPTAMMFCAVSSPAAINSLSGRMLPRLTCGPWSFASRGAMLRFACVAYAWWC